MSQFDGFFLWLEASVTNHVEEKSYDKTVEHPLKSVQFLCLFIQLLTAICYRCMYEHFDCPYEDLVLGQSKFTAFYIIILKISKKNAEWYIPIIDLLQ